MVQLTPIENIFTDIPQFRCFVCSPCNDRGLSLPFFLNEEDGEVLTFLACDSSLSGFPQIVHGGVQCAVLDELAFWALFAPWKILTVTAELSVRFLKPVPVGAKLVARAKGRKPRHHLSQVTAFLGPEGGEVCTEAQIVLYVPPRRVWQEQFGGRIPQELLPYLPPS